jgi:hypothetical protein
MNTLDIYLYKVVVVVPTRAAIYVIVLHKFISNRSVLSSLYYLRKHSVIKVDKTALLPTL